MATIDDVNASITKLNQSVLDMNRAVSDTTDTMMNMVKGMKKVVTNSSATGAQIADVGAIYGDFTDDLTDYNEAIEKLRAKTLSAAKWQQEIVEQHMRNKESLNDLNRALIKNTEILRRARLPDTDADKLNFNPEQMKALEGRQRILTEGKEKAEKTMAKSSKEVTNAFKGMPGILGKVTTGFSALMGFFSKLLGPVMFVISALDGQRQQLKQMMAITGAAIEGTSMFDALVEKQRQAMKYGVSVEDMLKLSTANRQMTNALGGTSAALSVYDENMKSFYGMTGNLTEAMQMAFEQMTNFAQKGITPTSGALKAYVNDVETLHKQTGMAVGAIQGLFEEVANDIDSMTLLRAARSDEREAILANQRALIKNNVALGMSAEQAKEAAKMLNRMVAEKPLERIKKAAKMRALGAAFGVAGGEEAMRAMIAGPRASAEQKAALNSFNIGLANASDKLKGAGLASEIFSSQMLDATGLADQYGPGSPFSTTLGDVVAKPISELSSNFTKASDSQLTQGIMMVDIATNTFDELVKHGSWLSQIAGSVKTIGAEVGGWISEALNLGGISDKRMKGLMAPVNIKPKTPEMVPGKAGGGSAFPGTMFNVNEVGPESFIPNMLGKIIPLGGQLPPEFAQMVKQASDAAGGPMQMLYEYFTKDAKDMEEGQASSIDKSLSTMQESNKILLLIHEKLNRQIDLQQQQITATAMTEEEKSKIMDVGERMTNLKFATTTFNSAV